MKNKYQITNMKKAIPFSKRAMWCQRCGMTIAILMLCLSLASTSIGGQSVLHRTVSFEVKNMEIGAALHKLEKIAHVKFSYVPSQIDASRKVSLRVENQSITEVVSQLLAPLTEKHEAVGCKQILIQQAEPGRPGTSLLNDFYTPLADVVRGEVIDRETGEALPGVNIMLQGTTIGTTTDASGSYELNLPPAAGILVVSYVGYVTQEIEIGQ